MLTLQVVPVSFDVCPGCCSLGTAAPSCRSRSCTNAAPSCLLQPMSWICFIQPEFSVRINAFGQKLLQAGSESRLSEPLFLSFCWIYDDQVDRCVPLLSAGSSCQRGHRVCCGRATGGHVLWKTQHARQHSDWSLGARPFRNQKLRRNQRGRAAVLPGGESQQHSHLTVMFIDII